MGTDGSWGQNAARLGCLAAGKADRQASHAKIASCGGINCHHPGLKSLSCNSWPRLSKDAAHAVIRSLSGVPKYLKELVHSSSSQGFKA